jgi:hypothetical protein
VSDRPIRRGRDRRTDLGELNDDTEDRAFSRGMKGL